MATSKPDMSILWAAAGSVVKPADTKIQEGWVAEKPPFQTENWVQNRTDQYLRHLDERGSPEWLVSSEYVKGGICWYADKIWHSLVVNNIGNIPVDGQGFWVSEDYLDRRGDIMLGLLTFLTGLVLTQDAGIPTSQNIMFQSSSIVRAEIRRENNTTDFIITLYGGAGGQATELRITESGVMTLGGFRVWTEQNDGAGSGLDADTVDGYHATDLFNIANGIQIYTVPGIYNFTVPQATNLLYLSGAGGGQGGIGGGDGGIYTGCFYNNAPVSLPGSDLVVLSNTSLVTIEGGQFFDAQTLSNKPKATLRARGQSIDFDAEIVIPSAIDQNIICYSATNGPGGPGGDTMFARGGGKTNPTTPPDGQKGSGGMGGVGAGTWNGSGGVGGVSIKNLIINVVPGEVIQITIPSGSLGSNGAISQGSKGGDGYLEIRWGN